MGSRASRCLSWACTDRQKNPTNKQREDESKVFLQDVKKATSSVSSKDKPVADCSLDPSPVNKLVLDFAQKMSEEIISQVLLLCWEAEIHYEEFPFIDIECEYSI